MDFIPGYRMPPFMGNRYIHEPYKMNNIRNNNIKNDSIRNNNIKNNREEYNRQTNNNPKQDSQNPIFEIFGIKLYFDDILIISLILFLYNEGVRDNLLFISLILILMS